MDASNLWAQFDTADVPGTVRDKSGSVIPNASIVLTNDGTGFEAKTTTGPDGNYTFSNVKIGTYSVSARPATLGGASPTIAECPKSARTLWAIERDPR